MTTIITGRFQRQDQADEAMAELVLSGFSSDQATSFFVNPPGQHDLYPVGGDEDESPGTHGASAGAASGAIVGGTVGLAVGIATLPVLGPAAAVAAIGVAAYSGSLAGALDRMGAGSGPGQEAARIQSEADDALIRKSGMLVAVCTPTSPQQATAIRILFEREAVDVERAVGTFTDGQWVDFNPLAPMTPVARLGEVGGLST
jgi:hypothetical protein